MKPHVIYLVMGRTGEYEDRDEWIVCWRPTHAEGEVVRERCQAYCDTWQKPYGDGSGVEYTQTAGYKPIDHPLGVEWHSYVDAGPDPGMRIDYTGTKYRTVAVADDPRADTKET